MVCRREQPTWTNGGRPDLHNRCAPAQPRTSQPFLTTLNSTNCTQLYSTSCIALGCFLLSLGTSSLAHVAEPPQYRTVQYHTVQMLFSTMQYTALQCTAVQSSAAQDTTVLYSLISTVQSKAAPSAGMAIETLTFLRCRAQAHIASSYRKLISQAHISSSMRAPC